MSDLRRILNEVKRKPSVVPVDMTEEWGVTVYVRSLTTGETRRFQEIFEADSNEAVLAMVCLGLCDESGNSVYSYPEDKNELDKFLLSDLSKICQAVNNAALALEVQKKD